MQQAVGPAKPVRADALCLLLITALSAIPYVARLGFYSDDWGLLAELHFRARGAGLDIVEVVEGYGARPLHGLYNLLLFELFALQPLGYHLVNTAVIAASITLFYLLLVRMDAGRLEALGAAIILIFLPQLSTVRVWIAANMIPLSMLFCLGSLHWQLSFVRSGRKRWAALASVAAILSLAAYETFAPLIGGFAIALLALHWHQHRGNRRNLRSVIPLALILAGILLAVVFKLAVSDRAGPLSDAQRYLKGLEQLVRWDYDWRVDSSLNIFAALNVHFWKPVVGWAGAAPALVTGRLGLVPLAAAAAVAALAWWRLRAPQGVGTRKMRTLHLFLLGVAALLLGPAAYLIAPAILFSPTGIANRALVAGSLGVAMIFVSAATLAARAAPDGSRQTAFTLIVTCSAFLGFGRIAQITDHWAQAPLLQRHVLERAKSDLRALPAGSTVILDGVCPYHGPAVIFETWWDFGGALSLALDRGLSGEVVSPRMAVTPKGLTTSIYEEPRFYPFGPDLYVYNPDLRLLARLDGAEAARSYFSRAGRWVQRCPESYVGHGVPI